MQVRCRNGTGLRYRPACRPRLQGRNRCHSVLDVATSGADESQEAWLKVLSLREELNVCVRAEDFAKAAELRDEIAQLTSGLTLLQQHEHFLLDQLQTGDVRQQQQSLASLAEVSSSQHVVRRVAKCLHDEHLVASAEAALQAIWLRHPSRADVNDMMGEGLLLMRESHTYAQAEKVFDKLIAADPDFAEGWNKRATLRFLLKRFRDALDDCEVVIRLQPLHYAAHSGMGLCYVQLREYSKAIGAFERALEINPSLPQIQRYLRALRVENS